MSKNVRKRILLALFLIFIGVIIGLLTRVGFFHSLDLFITTFIQKIQPYWFVVLMRFISIFEFGVILIVLPAFIYLMTKGEKLAAYLVLTAGLSWFLMRLLKVIFNIPCPTNEEVKVLYTFRNLADSLHKIYKGDYLNTKVCYPSGHVFDYIALWGTIIYLRNKITNSEIAQKVIKIFGILLITTVGISRVSLGAHFLSDVIGGYFLGFGWFFTLILFYNMLAESKQNRARKK